MEDLIAGSSEAIDNNLNQVLAKVSPSLLRHRRSPSPSVSSATSNITPAQPDKNARESLVSATGEATSEVDSKGRSSSDGQNSSSDQLQVPGQPSGAATTTAYLSKSPSTGSMGKSASGKSKGGPSERTRKKKSWYSVFYPSYKSRSADFKKLFKDVPDEERLLVGKKKLSVGDRPLIRKRAGVKISHLKLN